MRGEDRRQQVVRARVLVGERRLDRGLDLVGDVALELGQRLAVERQLGREPRQRILRLPLLDRAGVAHVGQVRAHRVLHAAERLQLEQRRPVAGARAGERTRDRLLDRRDVVAVDDLARHPVAGGALGDVLDRALRAPVGRQRELVVLADEDDRQLPRRGEVHALVHRALAGGAVAEVRDHRLVGAAQLRGQAGAAGVRDARRRRCRCSRGCRARGRRCASSRRAPCSSPSACRTSRPSSGAGRRRPRSGGRASGGGRRGSPSRASRSRRRRRSPPGRRSCAPCRRSRPPGRAPAARSSKRRISAICRYCATRESAATLMRLRRPLAELDDVAVGVVRVEALAAARAGRTTCIDRPGRAELDAALREVGVERLDVVHVQREVPGAVVARLGAARSGARSPCTRAARSRRRCPGCGGTRCPTRSPRGRRRSRRSRAPRTAAAMRSSRPSLPQ